MTGFTAGLRRRPRARRMCTVALAATLLLTSVASAARPLRVVFGDIPSVDTLALLVALERARERGIEIDISYYESEDVAAQAVLSGGADIGVGAPYAATDQERPAIRLIYQLNRMHFVPVFDSEYLQSWDDLHGAQVTVHSRGSGTEAIARLLADRHDIEYERIHYVAGSEVRAGAMLAGDIRAAIVDAAGWNLLQELGGERFQRASLHGLSATDEALYTTPSILDTRARELGVLLEEVHWTWRAISADPQAVVRLRDHYNLMPNLPPELDATIGPFYADAVSAGVFPKGGGSLETVQDDLDIYLFGADRGESSLSINDVWDFGPARAARERLDAR